MNGNTIEIDQLDLSDAPKLTTLANNINIWNNLRENIPYPYRESDAVNFIKLSKNEAPQQNYGIAYNGELCGIIGLIIQKDAYRKSGGIGFWIGEEFCRKESPPKQSMQLLDMALLIKSLLGSKLGFFE